MGLLRRFLIGMGRLLGRWGVERTIGGDGWLCELIDDIRFDASIGCLSAIDLFS